MEQEEHATRRIRSDARFDTDLTGVDFTKGPEGEKITTYTLMLKEGSNLSLSVATSLPMERA